jgi:hypothetical protein
MLRHCLLQILHQSRRPDVIAVHENAGRKSHRSMVEDVFTSLRIEGVDVIYQYTPDKLPMPEFFCWPLDVLLGLGCDYINKVDHDDLLYHNHFESQLSLIESTNNDYAMNANAGLLVLSNKGGYRHNPSVDFGTWNPTGAHPNNIIFNRAVAKEFVAQMFAHHGLNDDAVLAAYVLPKFKGVKFHTEPTSCFVAHGKNVSVAGWSDVPPQEVL